jgi:starch synthase (maltosyl-transferring)
MEELTNSDQREYMRPNFWPNTPDINPFHLQGANESKYIQRYVLAATLSSNVGIYGPVFEHMISDALPEKEEYLNSEKFQICNYNWDLNNKLITIISKINKIRHQREALQQTNNIKFCHIENESLLAFYKWNDARTDELLIIINLDEHHMQQGMVELPLYDLNVPKGHDIKVNDLITGNTYTWNKEWNFVELGPSLPFHIFDIKK